MLMFFYKEKLNLDLIFSWIGLDLNMLNRLKTNDLIETLNYFPVLAIVGPRQVGKTTLARLLSKKIRKEIVYIDLENQSDIAKLADPILFFENNENCCVILDEIQRNPELFPTLRSMIDKNRIAGRFLLLGSASPHLIRNSSETLAGRIVYEELTPFNIMEVNTVNSQEHHWLVGGFPDAFLAKNTAIRNKWLRSFIQTYVERDLPMLGLNINRSVIKKLWTMLAHLNGSLLNMTTLGKSLELTSTTIKRYISFLEEAFLIRQVQPYHVNIKKRLVKSPKIYVRDSGILHNLLGIVNFNDLNGNPILGFSWEGYVIEQICQLLPDGFEPFFYRTHQGAECDLVITKSGIPHISIEIKYTSSPKITKGLKQSLEDVGTKKNFIITPNTDDYMISKDIRVCNLQKFLTTYLEKKPS